MRHAIAAILATLVLGTGAASAQDWPAKPVKIMVPFGPGSTPDVVARLLADNFQKKYAGLTFIVENKAGASGNLGTEAVAKADPDGATIGVSIGGPLAINTLLFSNLRYDPAKEIAAVTQLITQSSILVVHASIGVNTVAELVALLKKDPGKYNFGSIGNGSLSHLAMEAIALKAGAKIVHLPFQGSPAAMTAVLRNDVQMGALPAISVASHAQTGPIKMLAVSTAKRSPFLPNLPTLKEAGIDVEADAWMGLIAPAGTPVRIIDQINRDAVEAIRSPDVRAKLAAQMMEPVGNSPQQFRAVIDAEIGRWAPVIKAANIKVGN